MGRNMDHIWHPAESQSDGPIKVLSCDLRTAQALASGPSSFPLTCLVPRTHWASWPPPGEPGSHALCSWTYYVTVVEDIFHQPL